MWQQRVSKAKVAGRNKQTNKQREKRRKVRGRARPQTDAAINGERGSQLEQ